MSRIGLNPIKIPEGVTINIEDGGTYHFKKIIVTGPKGSVEESLRRGVTLKIDNGILTISRDSESKQNKSYHGLYRSLIQNMVTGVTDGFVKKLEIVGIGYRAENQGNKVIFSLGYSHKIELVPPTGIEVTVDEQTKITVTGVSKQLVGEIAAKIRSFRKPEPYKGKGVRYADEVVRRKAVKSV